MFQRIWKFFRRTFGERTITIERETPTRLELRYFDLNTVFDRRENRITQNGLAVADLSMVEGIGLHESGRHSRGTPQWIVTLHLPGERSVEVGQVTDSMDASIVCAHIATVTGGKVEVRS